MPEPMTAPMPSEVRLSQPSDFLRRTSAFSESERSWSILLQLKSWDATRSSPIAPGKPQEHPAGYGLVVEKASIYLRERRGARSCDGCCLRLTPTLGRYRVP